MSEVIKTNVLIPLSADCGVIYVIALDSRLLELSGSNHGRQAGEAGGKMQEQWNVWR